MWTAAVAEQLRLRGHDVVAVVERRDLVRQPDYLLFRVAQSEERAILTENIDDFRGLAATHLRTGRTHCGVIFTTDRNLHRGSPRSIGRLVTALDTILSSGADLRDAELWLPAR
jgi:hypothetical protein